MTRETLGTLSLFQVRGGSGSHARAPEKRPRRAGGNEGSAPRAGGQTPRHTGATATRTKCTGIPPKNAAADQPDAVRAEPRGWGGEVDGRWGVEGRHGEAVRVKP